jgi:excisionase family DNA binding protein
MMRASLLGDAVRVEPSADERASATLLADAIGAPTERALSLLLDDGSTVPLSRGLINLLRASIGELAGGHAVTVLPSETELTPAEAAELLGLSRPFVVRLLDGGEIPSHHLPNSRHRRIKLSDVLAFQTQRDRRRTGRQRLNDIVEATGLPY